MKRKTTTQETLERAIKNKFLRQLKHLLEELTQEDEFSFSFCDWIWVTRFPLYDLKKNPTESDYL